MDLSRRAVLKGTFAASAIASIPASLNSFIEAPVFVLKPGRSTWSKKTEIDQNRSAAISIVSDIGYATMSIQYLLNWSRQ